MIFCQVKMDNFKKRNRAFFIIEKSSFGSHALKFLMKMMVFSPFP